jgi:hypothetical protein
VFRRVGYVRIAASMREEVLVSSRCYQRAHFRWRSSRSPARIEVLGFDSPVDIVVDMNCQVLCSPDVKRLQLLLEMRDLVRSHQMPQKHMTFAVRCLKLGLRCMIRVLAVTRLPLLPAQAV